MHTIICSGRSYNLPTVVLPPGVSTFDTIGDQYTFDGELEIGPFSPPNGLLVTPKPDPGEITVGGPLKFFFDNGGESIIYLSGGPLLIIPSRRCTQVLHAKVFGFSAWLCIDAEYVANAAVQKLCGVGE